MKLSQYAKLNSVTYQTAWNHYKNGLISGAYQLPSGTVVIPDGGSNGKTVVYARVSSSQNRKNLKSQSKRLVDFCNANGWEVSQVIEECGSGVNDSRPKLLKMLKDDSISRIVVEHKDRLTRFGFNYIKELFKGELIVVNVVDTDEEDIIQDLTSIITSFCAKIYGKRRSSRKTERLIRELKENEK